ncbi:MAG TPA: hypothetical protein ENH40_05375 [Nitrospirae bacterium]|nr:hypothetical protein [Nitrospirota bacterium]
MDITLNSDDITIPESFIVKDEGGENTDFAKSITGALGVLGNVSGVEIPEKLRVLQEGSDSAVDLGGSFSKLIGSYGELEKRMGSGEAPPKDATGYKADFSKLPEAMKMADGEEKKFLEAMHAAGMGNKSVQGVIDYYGTILEGAQKNLGATKEKLLEDYLKGRHDESMTALKEVYGEDKMDLYTDFANKVADKFGESLSDDEKKSLVANAGTFKLLVEIGKEIIPEDAPPSSDGGRNNEDIEKIMADKEGPYWNKKHEDHEKTVALVKAYFQRTHNK